MTVLSRSGGQDRTGGLTTPAPGSSLLKAQHLWPLWAVARILTFALLAFHREARVMTDVMLYQSWSLDAWDHGLLPGRDYHWEYPPGAFPVIVLPLAIHASATYATAFATQLLLLDALLLEQLRRRALRGGQRLGVVLWLLTPALLGPMTFARLDLVPTSLCVVAVACVAARPRAAGGLLAVATLVKLWPVVVLAALVSATRERQKLLTSYAWVLVVGLVAALASGVTGALLSAVGTQQSRGVQVEALVALPWMWVRAAGGAVLLVFRQYATDVDVTGLGTIAWGFTLGVAVALALVLLKVARSREATRAAAPLATAAVALTVLADKVLSPQYLLWVLGLMALMLCEPGAYQRPLFLLGGAAALLTQLVFPVSYDELLGRAVLPLALLTGRDLLLVTMAYLLVRRSLGTVQEAQL